MKFQNPSKHGSKYMIDLKSVTYGQTDGWTSPKQCPLNFFKVRGIKFECYLLKFGSAISGSKVMDTFSWEVFPSLLKKASTLNGSMS